MSPAEALVEWLRVGVTMQETDPAAFAAIVERAAEMAGLRQRASEPGRDRRRGLRVLAGGAR